MHDVLWSQFCNLRAFFRELKKKEKKKENFDGEVHGQI